MRYNRVYMHARQRIYKRGGGRIAVRTGARLRLKFAHLSRYWWKFYNAARFELWRVDAEGKRTVKVRTGPEGLLLPARPHPHPPDAARARRSSRSTRPATPTPPRRQVTLGTSVGWADIYPPSYPEQWIDVTGLRGCFAYVHIADPENGVYESNEDNNEAQLIVRLPYRAASAARGLPRPRPRASSTTRGSTPSSAGRAEALGAHPLGRRSRRPAAAELAASTNPFEPHTNAVPASERRGRAISSASMRPVWPAQPAGGSRV